MKNNVKAKGSTILFSSAVPLKWLFLRSIGYILSFEIVASFSINLKCGEKIHLFCCTEYIFIEFKLSLKSE